MLLSMQNGDCIEQPAEVPDEGYAKVIHVFVRETRKNPFTDLVLAACRFVLFESEAPRDPCVAFLRRTA